MLKNYFKLARRGLKKNRLVSVINIAGMAVGLGTCLMISLLLHG